VVSFHGGPEGQERPAWSPVAQSLVAAGLTVLAPDVRGSGGYGRAFTTCDDGAGREASFDDVPASVAALVADGIAEPGRVGAHGWSYGGYLTLVALTRWPELFAAGVSLAGMSDLRTFFAGTEPWMAAASVTEYGDPATEADLLASLSPLPALDRVSAPVLLVHGDRDTNVPVGESVQAAAALAARQHPSELLLLEGEGHTIVGHDAVVELSDRVAGWFDRWL
jgi:dipeptidyl aminopeptidase/acylaminoacyl peptidase